LLLEKVAAHVEKQGILLFPFRKSSNHCTILLFAFRKSSNHCTIGFRKAEIVVEADVPCRASSAIYG